MVFQIDGKQEIETCKDLSSFNNLHPITTSSI